MNFSDYDDRPAKKRRFFVEPSPEKENIPCPIATHTDVDLSSPLELPEDEKKQGICDGHSERANPDNGFDSQLLESFVGEKVPLEVLSELRKLAGDNLEQGTFLLRQFMPRVQAYDCSYQYLP